MLDALWPDFYDNHVLTDLSCCPLHILWKRLTLKVERNSRHSKWGQVVSRGSDELSKRSSHNSGLGSWSAHCMIKTARYQDGCLVTLARSCLGCSILHQSSCFETSLSFQFSFLPQRQQVMAQLVKNLTGYLFLASVWSSLGYLGTLGSTLSVPVFRYFLNQMKRNPPQLVEGKW